MNELIMEIVNFLIENKVTIKATADESLIVINQETEEEYIIKDLGCPI